MILFMYEVYVYKAWSAEMFLGEYSELVVIFSSKISKMVTSKPNH